MSVLLLPLSGLIPLLRLVAIGLSLTALLDVFVHPRSAFVAAGEQSKIFWLGLMTAGLFVTLLGLGVAILYFVTVRPVVEMAGRLGSRGDDGNSAYIRG